MILNPSGADLKETEKLIKYISNSLKPGNKDYIMEVVDRIVAGYEHQSGKDYDGYLP